MRTPPTWLIHTLGASGALALAGMVMATAGEILDSEPLRYVGGVLTLPLSAVFVVALLLVVVGAFSGALLSLPRAPERVRSWWARASRRPRRG